MIKLLTPNPALMVESGERVMLAADLHLGLEYELSRQGISIPYQWNRILDEMMVLLEEHKPDRLVLLGDVKHGVPATSFSEKLVAGTPCFTSPRRMSLSGRCSSRRTINSSSTLFHW